MGRRKPGKQLLPASEGVSNLLGSPASGEVVGEYDPKIVDRLVSNLLGSPASGEERTKPPRWLHPEGGFQFIGFPSEWGDSTMFQLSSSFSFPIYWVPQRVGRKDGRQFSALQIHVSNLLGSPASGETFFLDRTMKVKTGFQFIGFPSEWGANILFTNDEHLAGFQFIGFPSEWGDSGELLDVSTMFRFQFIGFPSEWGVSQQHPVVVPLEGAFPIYWVPQRVGSRPYLR